MGPLRLRKLIPQVGKLAFAGYLAWLGWDALGPRKPEVGAARRELADRLVPAMVEDLQAARGNVRSAVLLHLKNDPSDYITNHLRQEIEQSGILDLQDRSVVEKTRDLLRLRHPSYGDTAAALAAGREQRVDGVLFGTVQAFESGADGTRLDLDLRFAGTSDGRLLLDRRYSKDSAGGVLNSAMVQEHLGRLGPIQRLLGWALAVLLLPVFTIGFIRAMVRKESNRSNAFTLIVYTLAAGLLAYLLIMPDFGSGLSLLIFAALVGLAFAYNIFIMTFAVKLEKA